MATLLTTDELKRYIETDIDDDILQQIIDSNEEDIIKLYGAHANEGNRTDVLQGNGTDSLILKHPASTIISVTEEENNETLVLAIDDYELSKPMVLKRLNTGTNPRVIWPGEDNSTEGFTSSWPSKVTVVYTPINYDNRRRMVLVDLCKLELAFSGLRIQGIGDYRETEILDPEMRRRDILSRLLIRGVPF